MMKNKNDYSVKNVYLERASKTQKLLQLLNEELDNIELNVDKLQEATTIDEVKKSESALIAQVQMRIGIMTMLGCFIDDLIDVQITDYLDDTASDNNEYKGESNNEN